MLAKRHKTLSIIMTLCLCLAILAPVFVAPPAAQAATVTATSTPMVAKDANGNLGALIINFDLLTPGLHRAVIKLPSGFNLYDAENRVKPMSDSAIALMDGGAVDCTLLTSDPRKPSNQMQFTVNVPEDEGILEDVKFGLALNEVYIPSTADATINATVLKLDGDFTDAVIPVGRTSAGAVDLVRTDPPTWSAAQWNTTPFQIHVREDVAGGLEVANATLKLKLPKGFSWYGCSPALFPGNEPLPNDVLVEGITDGRTLTINRSGVVDAKHTFTLNVMVEVDEEEAAAGDVIATVSGRSTSNVSELKLGAWADYGYSVTAEDPDTEVTAGLGEELISKVVFKENIAGSLLNGRSVIATLPSGVRWTNEEFSTVSKTGNVKIEFRRNANDLAKAKGIITNSGSKGECWLDKAEIDVAVDYKGPIEIQFSGSAGVNDLIQVANAVAPITVSADIKDVKIGMQKQAAGNITVTENKAEVFQSPGSLILEAPAGVTWAKLPTVTVVEGDVDLDTITRGWSPQNRHQLRIPIRSQSVEASKIEISDVAFTLDRTVPEGALKLAVYGDAVAQVNFTNHNTAGVAVVANCVTPAPEEGTVGAAVAQFRIGSNIYQMNGVSRVMDVAPYIKGDRTYVPVRYLAYALGVAEADVVWDEASQKVTLTKGDNVVEMTIGSTTLTVNGEAQTMDVAPEITNDRTMLPARYVAEGFGYMVGWDNATRTVLLSAQV